MSQEGQSKTALANSNRTLFLAVIGVVALVAFLALSDSSDAQPDKPTQASGANTGKTSSTQVAQAVLTEAAGIYNQSVAATAAASRGVTLELLNRRDVNSVLEWLYYGLDADDADAITSLIPSSNFGYAFYIEGGQSVTTAEFADQLSDRLQRSSPVCLGYSVDEYSMQVWTDYWTPDWEMTEVCYADCEAYDPPYTSQTAGFLFWQNNGQWELSALYLNTPDKYYFSDWPLTPCGVEPSAAAPTAKPEEAGSCPGAPVQRLEVGEKARICTQEDRIILREGPSRSFDALKRYEPGTVLDVIGGPSCANDWSWWLVEAPDGVQGWMAEGGDSQDPYYLCPVR